MSFLLKNIYGSYLVKYVQNRWCELKLLLEGLECYEDTKAYNITKVTAELKSDDVHCVSKNKPT